MISFQQVSKVFSEGVLALDCITIDITSGQSLALLGENGAGKTTFIRLALGLLEPTQGNVLFSPQWCPGSPEVASVLAGEGCYSDLTVIENFKFFSSLYGLLDERKVRDSVELLDRFGQAAIVNKKFGSLSTGQKRLATLCRAMVSKPTLVILDEITANLDPSNQRLVHDYLLDYQRDYGATVVLSSHDLRQVERLGGKVVVFSLGKLTYSFDTVDLPELTCCSFLGLSPDQQRVLSSLEIPSFSLRQGCVSFVGPHREKTVLLSTSQQIGVTVNAECRPATLEDIYLAHSRHGNGTIT